MTNKQIWMASFLIGFTLWVLFGCKTQEAPHQEKPTTTTTIEEPAEESTTSTTVKQYVVMKTWQKEYEGMIAQALRKNPALLADLKMKSICPLFASLSLEGREEAFIDLIWAMAVYESNQNAYTMYLEKTFDELDAITGLPVISEGLMQMSYQDALWYKGCPFDYKKDAAAHNDDWKNRRGASSWESRHPEKDTINPEKNLQCTVAVMAKLLTNPKFNGWTAEAVLERYWNVLKVPRRADVLKKFKTRADYCYRDL